MVARRTMAAPMQDAFAVHHAPCQTVDEAAHARAKEGDHPQKDGRLTWREDVDGEGQLSSRGYVA